MNNPPLFAFIVVLAFLAIIFAWISLAAYLDWRMP